MIIEKIIILETEGLLMGVTINPESWENPMKINNLMED